MVMRLVVMVVVVVVSLERQGKARRRLSLAGSHSRVVDGQGGEQLKPVPERQAKTIIDDIRLTAVPVSNTPGYCS